MFGQFLAENNQKTTIMNMLDFNTQIQKF